MLTINFKYLLGPKDVGIRPILLPTKGSWRNKNKMQKSNVVERYPNGRSSLHNYQPNQQSFYQQRQRALGPHMSNTHSVTNRSQQCAPLYRKTKENKSTSSEVHDFDRYVADFKVKQMLKAKVRYFVLHAESKELIIESFKSARKWQYSPNMLRQFKTIKNVSVNQCIGMECLVICFSF